MVLDGGVIWPFGSSIVVVGAGSWEDERWQSWQISRGREMERGKGYTPRAF